MSSNHTLCTPFCCTPSWVLFSQTRREERRERERERRKREEREERNKKGKREEKQWEKRRRKRKREKENENNENEDVVFGKRDANCPPTDSRLRSCSYTPVCCGTYRCLVRTHGTEKKNRVMVSNTAHHFDRQKIMNHQESHAGNIPKWHPSSMLL